MAYYMVYWPQARVTELKKAGDKGPIKVVLGSIHSKMPTILKICQRGFGLFPCLNKLKNPTKFTKTPLAAVSNGQFGGKRAVLLIHGSCLMR